MPKRTSKIQKFEFGISIDPEVIIKQYASEEFDRRRSCVQHEFDSWIKTICELQRAVKSLKTQIDRLESEHKIK